MLSVQEVSDLMLQWQEDPTCEALVANHLQKKTSKEIPPSNNDPTLQHLVDESKTSEWQTLIENGAIKVHYGKRTEAINSHRFISRFVITRKPLEENQHVDPNDPTTFKVKSRWCLQGHLDPNLDRKLEDGILKSPTFAQIERMLPMQIISSYQWDLQLGDIKSPPEAVLEVVGNVYGQNDAPCAWYCTFNDEAVQSGWLRSKLDSCLYFPRDDQSRLYGIVGVHVDDTAVGGCGPVFEKAVAKPKSRFPYRKWRTQIGEFCGALYRQDPSTKAISMSQQTFAGSLKHASTPKGTDNGKSLNESQKRVLRVINESLNWLSSQSRPDLSVQTSMCQQGFPNPTIRNLRDANNAIRHAKQHKYLTIAFHPIPPDELSLCCHSDAAFANVGTHTHTQAGYVVAFVNKTKWVGQLVQH